MTLVQPARTGGPVTLWFVGGLPVRVLIGGTRFRILDDPRCAAINGQLYWRVRAETDDGETATFDLRHDPGGWVLAGIDESVHRRR